LLLVRLPGLLLRRLSWPLQWLVLLLLLLGGVLLRELPVLLTAIGFGPCSR